MNGDNSNVSAAFEMVLEEAEAEVDLVQKEGSKAFAAGDLEYARLAETPDETI